MQNRALWVFFSFIICLSIFYLKFCLYKYVYVYKFELKFISYGLNWSKLENYSDWRGRLCTVPYTTMGKKGTPSKKTSRANQNQKEPEPEPDSSKKVIEDSNKNNTNLQKNGVENVQEDKKGLKTESSLNFSVLSSNDKEKNDNDFEDIYLTPNPNQKGKGKSFR